MSLSINDRARQVINAGRPNTWPVWKERLFGYRGTALLDQGFTTCDSQEDEAPSYVRTQGALRVTVHAPGADRSGGMVEYDYLDSSVRPTIEPVTEEVTSRILNGCSNHILACGLGDNLVMPDLCNGGVSHVG